MTQEEACRVYALRNYAEAMHDAHCTKGKKCLWVEEGNTWAEAQTAGVWLYGEEHQKWLYLAQTHASLMEVVITQAKGN